ncbi:hypothetical protein HK096_002210, partial [Nowakowskiella sp. JEL0078]
ALILPTDDEKVNISAILSRLGTLFFPVQLNFTIAFVSSVKKIMEIFTGKDQVETTQTKGLNSTTDSEQISTIKTNFKISTLFNQPTNNETSTISMTRIVHPTLILDFSERTPAPAKEMQTPNSSKFSSMVESPSFSTAFSPLLKPQKTSPSSYLNQQAPITPILPKPPTSYNSNPLQNQSLPQIGVMNAITPFNSQNRNDEISVSLNDLIIVDVMFQDGWCVGSNLTTGLRGYFPAITFGGNSEINRNSSKCLEAPIDHTHSPRIPRKASLIINGAKSGEKKMEPFTSPYATDEASNSRSQIAQIAGVDTPINTTLMVILAYTAEKNDEMTLVPGEKLILVKTFKDGWGLGRKGELEGVFPLSSSIVWDE